jgi:hypothetical protein
LAFHNQWVGFNRQQIHVNAPKASGGVGILVKNWLIDLFSISVLGIKFTKHNSDFEFVVFACYLPPENSNRGRDAQGFFAHLLSQIYLHNENNGTCIFVLGDVNCRIGNLQEVLNDVDENTDRTSIGSTINQHGHEFIEFLNEANFCILNGRFPDDNFTCISYVYLLIYLD